MADKYLPCKHTKREKIDLDVSEDVIKAIAYDYRTLPIFEKGLFEYTSKRHYSLQTNEYLACRWREYIKNIEHLVRSPFQFVDVRDYHFYCSKNSYLPSLSIHMKTDFRRKLKPGPGVDFRGQMPIPNELHMKRLVSSNKETSHAPKRNAKTSKDNKMVKDNIVREKK